MGLGCLAGFIGSLSSRGWLRKRKASLRGRQRSRRCSTDAMAKAAQPLTGDPDDPDSPPLFPNKVVIQLVDVDDKSRPWYRRRRIDQNLYR
jgi:hypothetical protein